MAILITIPVKVTLEYTIDRCYDCEFFKEHGAPYGDGNKCEHDEYLMMTL